MISFSALVFMWGPAVKETFIRFASWHSLFVVLSVISEAVRILAPGTGHFSSVLSHTAFCFFFPVVESLKSGNIYPGLPSWKIEKEVLTPLPVLLPQDGGFGIQQEIRQAYSWRLKQLWVFTF